MSTYALYTNSFSLSRASSNRGLSKQCPPRRILASSAPLPKEGLESEARSTDGRSAAPDRGACLGRAGRAARVRMLPRPQARLRDPAHGLHGRPGGHQDMPGRPQDPRETDRASGSSREHLRRPRTSRSSAAQAWGLDWPRPCRGTQGEAAREPGLQKRPPLIARDLRIRLKSDPKNPSKRLADLDEEHTLQLNDFETRAPSLP